MRFGGLCEISALKAFVPYACEGLCGKTKWRGCIPACTEPHVKPTHWTWDSGKGAGYGWGRGVGAAVRHHSNQFESLSLPVQFINKVLNCVLCLQPATESEKNSLCISAHMIGDLHIQYVKVPLMSRLMFEFLRDICCRQDNKIS